MTLRAEDLMDAIAGPNGHGSAPADRTSVASVALVAPSAPEWPDPPAEEAFHGLAGEYVRAVEPETEADPAAILVQFLVAFGSAAGRSRFVRVEADRHYPNEWCLIVAESSKGRKGVSLGHALRPVALADAAWNDNQVMRGLSSGEGLMHAVRDAVLERRRAKTGDEKTRADEHGFIVEETTRASPTSACSR